MAGMFGKGIVMLGKVSDPPMSGFTDVRIDRQTVFGNKFPIRLTKSRSKSCILYDKWAKNRMLLDGVYAKRIKQLRARVKSGENIRLLCHCHPKQCHGLTIRALVLGV